MLKGRLGVERSTTVGYRYVWPKRWSIFLLFYFSDAMKMQNFLVAPSSAYVKDLNVNVGDTVRNGDTLIRLDC